ncbi:RdgB/HAM1 family non-canonical purine NTP pyrophosphatase [Sinimarinibacterium sp. CAU 1509]|uniref:RdgB/HAM1 family non-canonical purine NTP pyrophosphatase n=1 Tax=Sinimarinibacterium sp. CAU 1509 TaxID=2562283 RepID=UPI0010AC655A|nr:RdgB/HAM1 family non-canonical purine NTP pyrophosphatase [Sinimarinibacterium sp. CAU 1509]TJY58348.1 RdgB/HAM1 family non-canonical purine NTP pyrophosphatase [Sinimarinibacterium sp. CAU 1509]
MGAAPTQLVVASRNAKKLRELQPLLSPLGLDLRSISEFGADDVEETAPTFVENALIKARHACRISGLPAIADDSGLEVDYLGGAPGVRSARYAGEPSNDAANNRKLLEALHGVDPARRAARFVCTMVYLRHADDPVPLIAQGLWPGRILETPRGANGFGYDPLFWVDDHGCSAADLDAAVKNRISHRGQAVAQLRQLLHG